MATPSRGRSKVGFSLVVLALLLACAPGTATPSAPTAPTPAPAAQAPARPADPAPAVPPSLHKLQVAVTLNVTQAPLLLAMEKGYFSQAGIELELVPLGGGAEMIAPLSTGEIDAAIGGISASLFNALIRGVDAKIVSDFSRMSRGHGFGGYLVRNDVELPTLASIRGKRVAVNNPGSPCHYMVGKMLESVGLAMADVELVNLPFPTVPGAMAKKEIEAACAAEPWVTNTVRAGDARLALTYDEIVPDMQTSVIMVSNRLAADRPLTERFIAAFLRAAPEGKEKSPETLEIVARHTGINVDVLRDTFWTDVDSGGRINVDSIKDQLDFFTRVGAVQGSLDLDRIIDQSYLPRR